MLDLPDTEFWDLITGARMPLRPQWLTILELLQKA